MRTERVGVLVVRAWRDPAVPGFRARVTSRISLNDSDEVVEQVHTIEGARKVVEAWLRNFTAESDGDTGAGAG